MIIGIIGNGVVGGATAEAFKDHEIRITDRLRSRETHQLSDVLESGIIFICLPTPQKEDSMECDTTAIDSFFEYGLPSRFEKANFVLRSTVPVGYTRKARETFDLPNLVHSPEFLTARTAKEDACNPTRMVIGYPGPNPLTRAKSLHDLYKETFTFKGDCEECGGLGYLKQGGLPECYACEGSGDRAAQIFEMSSDESEFVKLLQNAFSAVKIAFFNEARTFSDLKGLDWERCVKALLAGGWINPMHTQVPGPDGKRGFGGTCLPKDLASFAFQLLTNDLRADMSAGAYDRNLIDRERT